MLKRNDIAEVAISRFGDRGKSIAKVDGFTVMVNGGVPGDELSVRVIRKKRRHAEAEIVEVLKPSKLRTSPRCVHFGVCGGCKWQHVDYEAQLQAKTDSVRDALSRLAGINDPVVLPAIGADPTYYYRNKMEYSFGSRRWLTRNEISSGQVFDESVYGGFHVSGNYTKILDLGECHLQDPISFKILDAVRRLARTEGWSAWDVKAATGFMRHLVIRTSSASDDVMVNLVTFGFDDQKMEKVADVVRSFPRVTSLVNTSNTGVAQTAYGKTRIVFGSGLMVDSIGGYEFEISPHAFFQTNTNQAERLYEVVRDTGKFRKTDHVYDLYSGAGTIAIYLSDYVGKVTGIEVIRSAVRNAQDNARRNDIENCSFIEGDMLKVLNADLFSSHGRPDVIVVDPPRAGMHPKVVKRLAELKPERLVYVSCNPRTQARDIELLGPGWVAGPSQPVDMFPHTHHIENVVLLTPEEAT